MTQATPVALAHFAHSISSGVPWGKALVSAVGMWTAPREQVDGRELDYLIGGEAFDWLLLAERLLRGVDELLPGTVPTEAWERLLFRGELPAGVTPAEFKEGLGVSKYRAHLNYFYGVVVEEALWVAVERELQKERGVRGLHHPVGVLDLVSERLYRAGHAALTRRFRRERNARSTVKFTLAEWKEYTYWLFKLRVGRSDSARLASDTRKGLRMLEELRGAADFTAAEPHGGSVNGQANEQGSEPSAETTHPTEDVEEAACS